MEQGQIGSLLSPGSSTCWIWSRSQRKGDGDFYPLVIFFADVNNAAVLANDDFGQGNVPPVGYRLAFIRGDVQRKGIEKLFQVIIGEVWRMVTQRYGRLGPIFIGAHLQVSMFPHLTPGVFQQVGQCLFKQFRIQLYRAQALIQSGFNGKSVCAGFSFEDRQWPG